MAFALSLPRIWPFARGARGAAGTVSGEAGTCKVQVVRSVTEWSMDTPTERSIQNACELRRRPCFTLSLNTRA
jgi:hypothetical protein